MTPLLQPINRAHAFNLEDITINIRQCLFTIIGIAASVMVLAIEKIGDFFLFVPSEQFYIDIIVSALLISAGILLDTNLRKLARERDVQKELNRVNKELSRSNKDLQKSLADIKVLRGLIPICATCKRIRDDTGYWQKVEDYLRQHSEANFTHGVCPECAARVRKDFMKEKQG